MGEEIDLEKSQSSDSFSVKSSLFHQAAKLHGSHQDTSDTPSSSTGVKNAFSSRTDYDKLCLSLLCGLPNEQELALNVSTILSNEGNYMLHLEQTPKLIDLLVAQTGVFPLGDDQLKMLYLESWNNLKGRNMHKFWRSTLDLENEQLMDLLQLDLGAYDPHCKLLNLETELGAHNVEGQRVLRIALILHNLSFEKNNVLPLVTSRNFMRFMLLCIHSSWASLKQAAYDTLSNLASAIKISIEKDVYSRIVFRTVVDGILSCDRYMNIRSLDILAQLCSHESNEDVLPTLLEVEVYQRMVSFLTVRDVMLLIYTLETLYALSDLGRYACDKIVSVHRCIGALVSLLTLDPAEYGPSGQINMKVVKTLVPADADSETDCTGTVVEETPLSEATTAVPTTTTTVTTTTATTNIIEPVDAEGFAINWLKSTYEHSPGNSVSRNEIYSDYLTTCTKTGRKDIVNANVFAEFVKKAFPMCGVKKCESKGIITFHHDGLQKKGIGSKMITPVSASAANTSLPKVTTPSTPVSCKPPQKTTFNSILKSQLSSAPKVIPTTPVKNPTQILSNQKLQLSPQPQNVQQRTIVSSAASNPGSSTLIKSLLASKVQQRNLQSQVVPSNVSKMVIYSPGSSGLIGPHTTVVRCIRPGSLHAVNLGTQIRSPLQTCLVSNNGATRIITNASPRFVKNTTVIRHTLQPQMIKQGIVSTSAPRINGLQRDMQIVDDATSQLTQVVQVNTQPGQQLSQIQQGQVNTQQTQINTQQSQSLHVNNPQIQINSQQNQVISQQNQQVLKTQQTQLNAQQNQQVLQTPQVQANNQQTQQILSQQVIQVNNPQQTLQTQQTQSNAPQSQQILKNLPSQVTVSQNQQILQNLQNQLNAPQNQQFLQNLQNQLNAPQNQQLLQNLQNQLNAPQNQQLLQTLQNQLNAPQNQQKLQSQLNASQNQQNLQNQVNIQQNQQILQSQINVPQNQVTQQNQQILQSQQVQLTNQQNQQVLQTQVNTLQNQQNLHSQISTPQNQQILQSQQAQINNQQNQQLLQSQQIQSTSLQNQVLHSHLVQVNSQQNRQVLQSAICNQPSALPNGDNLQLIKTINANEDSNINYVPVIQNSELLKLIGGKDLPQSEIPVLVNSKPLLDDKSVKEPSQTIISTHEIKKDPLLNISIEQPEVQSQKILSSPTSILKSVLSDLDPQTDEIKRQQQQKDILRRAPLLNGLLDKGKLPLQSTVQSNAFLINGNESTAMEIVSPKESKPTQFVQLNQNSFVIPVSSFNTVMSNPQSNLILMPVSSMNSVISSSQLNSGIPVISSSQLNSGIPVLSSSQLNSGIPIISSSQLNSGIPVISSSQLNSGISVISSSQLNSGVPVINSPPLNSGVLATSPVNSNTFISSSTSTVQLSVPNPVIPSNATFLSNGSNLMQLCIGQTTLSGTVEVQSDQQGVVRLHIESPENSNQGSDLSSISDITRTLECASKALLKTNAECSTQVSFSDVCETAAPTVVTTTITTTSPSALTRTGQQFFVVTPTINQPQLQIQQPNFKFHILHTSIPKIEESVDLVTFPNLNISQTNQLQQSSSETSSASTTSLKRPSSDSSTQLNVPAAKKPCMDSKILSESLRTPTSVPCTVDSVSVSAKTLLDTKSLLLKSPQTDNIEAVSKLTTPKTVIKHAPKSELTNDKGNRTFSGLSSVNNQGNAATSHAPQKSAVGLEFMCEWKNCGLKFQSPSSVFLHATKTHAPLNSNDLVCLWEGCDSIKRRRLSHLTHLQDWHCNEGVLQSQALRRKQIAHTGKSSIPPPQKPPLHPGYAPDAALLAIKRHALQYINPKELSEEKESVLTKSIRLTSALILRNLVTHSNLARTYLRRFEADIAYLAMSPVESARTLAQCLSQLHTTHD